MARLTAELAEMRATLDAIRRGEVDAVVVNAKNDEEVYTLQSADLPFRELVEQMAEGALSLARDHTILYGNSFFSALVGVAQDELLRHSFMEFLDLDGQHAFADAVAAGAIAKLKVQIVSTCQTRIPVQLAITPPGAHSTRRTTVMVTDLRATRELDRVTQARDAAEAEVVARDRFLAMLGHELRNPLAAVANSVTVLQQRDLDGEQRQRVHGAMARHVERLHTLVDDLLDVTRVAQGKIVLKRELVSVRDLLDHVLEPLGPTFASRRQSLAISIDPPELSVAADRARLEQVFVNLLTNAAKFTEDGGSVSVDVKADPENVFLTVTDNGKGLSSDDLERIFEPFTQVTLLSGGLGIGLTLVRQLVELHGGTVRAESAGLGRGATFRIALPRVALKPVVREAGPTKLAPAGQTVLLVDDNEDAAAMLAMLLESLGIEVTLCHTGRQALDVAEALRPAIVLLDLGLPDITGYEVARTLRSRGHQDARIIAVTGFSHEEAKAQARGAGIDAHLVKPFSVEQILKVLDVPSAVAT